MCRLPVVYAMEMRSGIFRWCYMVPFRAVVPILVCVRKFLGDQLSSQQYDQVINLGVYTRCSAPDGQCIYRLVSPLDRLIRLTDQHTNCGGVEIL